MSEIDKEVTRLTLSIWEQFKNEPSSHLSELHKRDTKVISFLLRELAEANINFLHLQKELEMIKLIKLNK